jgi:hypothetical protein
MTNHEFVTNVPRPILVGNIPSYKILTEEWNLNPIYIIWPTISSVFNAFITCCLSSACYNTLYLQYTHIWRRNR